MSRMLVSRWVSEILSIIGFGTEYYRQKALLIKNSLIKYKVIYYVPNF